MPEIPSSMPTSELRRRVKTRLAWLEISQAQASELLGMDTSSLSRQLHREAPTQSFLEQIATLLGWTVEEMLDQDLDAIILRRHPCTVGTDGVTAGPAARIEVLRDWWDAFTRAA